MDVTNNSVNKQLFFFSFNDVKNTCNEFHSNNYLDEIVHSCHDLTPVLHSMKFHILLTCLYLVFDLCLNNIQFTIQSDWNPKQRFLCIEALRNQSNLKLTLSQIFWICSSAFFVSGHPPHISSAILKVCRNKQRCKCLLLGVSNVSIQVADTHIYTG